MRQIQSCSQSSLVRKDNSAEQHGIVLPPAALVLLAPQGRGPLLPSPAGSRWFCASKEAFSLDSTCLQGPGSPWWWERPPAASPCQRVMGRGELETSASCSAGGVGMGHRCSPWCPSAEPRPAGCPGEPSHRSRSPSSCSSGCRGPASPPPCSEMGSQPAQLPLQQPLP